MGHGFCSSGVPQHEQLKNGTQFSQRKIWDTVFAARVSRNNGDTEVVMGHWMIELYDDGKNTYIVHEKVRL